MCLSKVTEQWPIDQPQVYDKPQVGYKVFVGGNGGLSAAVRVEHSYYETGKWIEDTSISTIFGQDVAGYSSGYHIFTTKKAAKIWTTHEGEVCRKVLYNNVVATGTEAYGPVVVARKIYIIPTIWERIKNVFR